MKSSALLTSAVFHLTPTRTRFDLLINANNGKMEKFASGLLNPFLAHLKTARDQIAQGGYSIRLELEPARDAVWFTKGTVDRFVRFVSTPEILERVYTIESEILQIDEAISIQCNNDTGFRTVEDRQAKHVEKNQGTKATPETNDETAIVLYMPGADLPAANGSTGREENSKVQFLRVLETRKTVLQKEQGMAFARAVAAGFDIDDIEKLVSFSECFGASRLMDACSRFNELWKRKHETGQWLELEASEATTNLPGFSSTNGSDLMLCNGAIKRKDLVGECPLSHDEMGGADLSGDQKHPTDPQVAQEYFAGHFPHHMYPPWPIHSQPGAVPVFQPYPMPYYQNYPGNNPYFQPPYPSADESNSAGKTMSQKRRSTENLDMDASRARSHDDSELAKEASHTRESRTKATRLAKKSSKVVIRSINYITSQRDSSSGSDANSESESGTDVDTGDAIEGRLSSTRSSKRKGKQESVDTLNSTNDMFAEKEIDGGHWQAFQNCLLRGADEDKLAVDQGMFAMERDIKVKGRQKRAGEDPLTFGGRDPTDTRDEINGVNQSSENATCMSKASNDPLLISRREGQSGDGIGYREHQMNAEFNKLARNLIGARRTGNDDCMVHGRENQSNSTKYISDLVAVSGYDQATNSLDKNTLRNLTDESFVLPLRSSLQSQYGTDDRKALHMYSEPPATHQKATAAKTGSEVNYEPDDLGFMPERGLEKGTIGYDPALDYEMQAHANTRPVYDGNNVLVTDGKKGLKKSVKEQRSKGSVSSLEKKKIAVSRQGKPSKSSPLEEARARAEKLRSFKADLQKEKKQKEEEQVKRLETLKMERQKRIAARNGSIPSQSSVPSLQTKKQLPRKLSVGSQKVSKFSDSEPLSVSPLQGFPARIASLGSSDSKKPSKPRSSGSNSAGNRLSRSASSLSESKKESNSVKPESKASMVRIRRLSEPRVNSHHLGSSVKLQNSEPLFKPKRPHGPESKKISAIMNLDRTLAATLPELKIKTSKEPLNVVHCKSAAEETACKSDEDDNMVIEKTVVMLEGEKPYSPTVHTSKGKVGNSPITIDTADEPIKCHAEDQQNYKVSTISREQLPKLLGISNDEKPYKVSHPQVSSLEHSCNGNSEYYKVPPTSMTTGSESLTGHAVEQKNLKLEKLPETSEKPHVKESSKGIRRLLKFGRKNHSWAESIAELDNTSCNGSGVDDNAAGSASSSEVLTLKNLLSRDETPTTNTNQQKPSRHFSLLSPFRSKSGEKKQAA